MNLHNERGFSTVELMVATAVTGVLATFAVVGYMVYIPKSQSVEATQMINNQVLVVSQQLKKGQCTADGKDQLIKGKYGTLKISGKPLLSSGTSCPSGCKLTYTFGADTAKVIQGKVVDVNIMNNLKLSRTALTTLSDKFLADEFARSAVLAGDSCTSLSPTDPSITDGDDTGTDTGVTDPSNPGGGTDPTNPGGGGNGGTDPTNPGGGGNGGTDPVDPGGEGPEVIVKGGFASLHDLTHIMPSSPPQRSYTLSEVSLNSRHDPRSGIPIRFTWNASGTYGADVTKLEYTWEFANGDSTTIVLDTKERVNGQPNEFTFKYVAVIDPDCQTWDSCRNSMIRNSGGKSVSVGENIINFVSRNVPVFVVTPGAAFPAGVPIKTIKKIYRQ